MQFRGMTLMTIFLIREKITVAMVHDKSRSAARNILKLNGSS